MPAVAVLPRLYHYPIFPRGRPTPCRRARRNLERDLRPVSIDLGGADPHLLVYGDGETGKSNLLRVIVQGYRRRHSPDEIGIVVVDYRRSLLGVVPDEYLLAYCPTAERTAAVAREVAASIRQRLPGPDVTPEQLRTRSWWRGLRCCDSGRLRPRRHLRGQFATAGGVLQGRDLGFHLVLTPVRANGRSWIR